MGDPTPHRARRPALALGGVLLVVAVSWSLASFAHGGEPTLHVAPEAGNGAERPAPDGTSAALAASETAAEPAIRTAPDRVRGAIRGVVRDAADAPLPGWHVNLHAADTAPKSLRALASSLPAASTRTDRDGTFEFAGLAAGKWRVTAHAADSGLDVVLGAGETREVGLRVDDRGTVVALHVTSHGIAAENWRIQVPLDGTQDRFLITDANGDAACLLPPGAHRIDVRGWIVDSGSRREWTCSRTITVPPGAASVRCPVEIPISAVELVLVGALPPSDLVFTVAGCTEGEPEAEVFDVPGDQGRASIRLPPGEWRFGLRARGLLATNAPEVKAGAGAPRVVVEVAAEPASAVTLDLRGPDGRPFVLPQHSPAMLALLPRLVLGDRTFAAERLADGEGALVGSAPVGYAAVPFGRGTLKAQDRREHGALVLLPFDPIDDQIVDVARAEHRVVVSVQRRAFVELTACSRGGLQDVRARVRVFAGDTLVQPVCTPEQSRWQAFLPPGEYRVVVQRPESTSDHMLLVQRDPIAMRLRP